MPPPCSNGSRMQDIAEAKKRCARVAPILKTLAHPQRLFLLCRLAKGEATVSELRDACGASQSLISQHLTRMRREGLVQARRERQLRPLPHRRSQVVRPDPEPWRRLQ